MNADGGPFSRVAVLSGAGVSLESGEPIFGADAMRFWSGYDFSQIASLEGWRQNPERAWPLYLWLHHLRLRAQPNEGHRAIAAWQEDADVTVITQNLDDLHERAGSRTVLHIHGSIADFHCDTCESPYHGPVPDLPEPQLELAPPACECGGRIRPSVVWFGEPLPTDTWQRARQAVADAEILVVVGTSGEVYPASGLIDLACDAGAVVVEVNPEPTPLSQRATVTLRQNASVALPGLLGRLRVQG